MIPKRGANLRGQPRVAKPSSTAPGVNFRMASKAISNIGIALKI